MLHNQRWVCLLLCITAMAKTKEGEAAKKAAAEAAAKPPDEPPAPPPTPIEQLRANTELLEKAVRAKETRVLSGRLLRQTAAVRRQLDAEVLAEYVREALPAVLPSRGVLLAHLSKARLARCLGTISCTQVLGGSGAFVCYCLPVLHRWTVSGQVTQAYALDLMPKLMLPRFGNCKLRRLAGSRVGRLKGLGMPQ